MKNEIIGIEEGEERQNEFERWINAGGQIEDNGNGIEEEGDEQNGRRRAQIMMNGLIRNNEKMDLGRGRKRKGRRMDENGIGGGGEEEDGNGQQQKRIVDSQFEMLLGQAKLNYFNSQVNEYFYVLPIIQYFFYKKPPPLIVASFDFRHFIYFLVPLCLFRNINSR